MNHFTYERQGSATYLVYRADSSDELDTMCLGMITNNRIKGLAPTISTLLNGQRLVQYDVSSKVTAKQILSDIVTSKRLLGIFSGIADAILSAEEYMISPDNIMMDLEYMYVDVSDYHTELICVPVKKEKEWFDLPAFLKEIMFRIRVDQNENSDYFTKLLNVLNTEGAFSLTEFKKIVDELRIENTRSVVQKQSQAAPGNVVQTPPPQAAVQKQLQNVQQPTKEQLPPQQPQARPVMSHMPAAKPQMQTPPMPGAPVMPNQSAGVLPNGEKPMSMMYLLQHYSKENAAKYKAQKEQMKNQKAVGVPPQPQNGKKTAKKTKKQTVAAPAFQIPGQEAPRPVATPVAPVMSNAQQAVPPMPKPLQPVQPPQPPVVQPIQSVAMNFGQTTFLDESERGNTVILGSKSNAREARPMLTRKKNNEQILLNKPVFKIGKQQGYADYVIRDNGAISRSHANIISRDGNYYVVDTNSTNHVYVNGKAIACNEEVPIESGMTIRLADEEFRFSLY